MWGDGELVTRVRDVRWQVAVLLAASTLVTVAFTVTTLPLGYRAPSLHVALETASALVALLAAFLVFGRVQRDPSRSDLLLALALAVLAIGNFSLRAVPAVIGHASGRVAVWGATSTAVFGAAVLAAAANIPLRRLRRPRRDMRTGAAACAVLVVAVLLTTWLLGSHLPSPAAPVTGAEASARHPDLDVNLAFPVVQSGLAILYAACVFGFARRAMHYEDEFFRWLALACVLSMFSRINYVLYPSVYTNWVYLGDAFRLAFFAVLLIAVLREIARYWQVAAAAAALGERRRLARDLHDGLAQEVAFLRRNVRSLEDDGRNPELARRLAAAAERAESESRQLLAALSLPAEETFDVLLADTLGVVASREHVRVDLHAAAGVRLDHVRTEALLRIAAEAVANAARHGEIEDVRVTLEQHGGRVRLRVVDKGRGFDPQAARPSERGRGFGLISMHGRAEAVGAALSVSSRPGAGTEVEVSL